MKVAIMQPYFFPYIGYFQLIQAVDLFIIYDNIKYTKKGWINRNRFLQNGSDAVFSLPLKNDSDALDIGKRFLAPDFKKQKLLNPVREAYRKAPYFEQAFPVFESAVQSGEQNLFKFLHESLRAACDYLGIKTKIAISSEVESDSSLGNQDRVMALCKDVGADVYINPMGGQELYTKDAFRAKGIDLQFLKPRLWVYPQFGGEFVPWLSILDVMMFNSKEVIVEQLAGGYDLI